MGRQRPFVLSAGRAAGSAWQGPRRCDINGPKYIPGEELPGTSLKF